MEWRFVRGSREFFSFRFSGLCYFREFSCGQIGWFIFLSLVFDLGIESL